MICPACSAINTSCWSCNEDLPQPMTWTNHLDLLEEAINVSYAEMPDPQPLLDMESIVGAVCLCEAFVGEWWEDLPDE
jgi:hypothetical protein